MPNPDSMCRTSYIFIDYEKREDTIKGLVAAKVIELTNDGAVAYKI